MKAALVLALTAVLACAAPAAAQNGTIVGAGPGSPLAGPLFGGGELVWVELAGLNARLVGGDVGRPAQVLATATVSPSAQDVRTAFGASDSTLLLWAMSTIRVKGSEEPLGVEAFAGPRGAVRPLSGDAASPFRFPRVVGERVAFTVSLPGGGGAVRLLDPVSGQQTDVPMPSFISQWNAAGDLVAHVTADEAQQPAVTNWRTGAELYRAQLPAGWQPDVVDVAPDGTAIWTTRAPEGTAGPFAHGISTPEAPAVRPVALPGDAIVRELAGGRILYEQQGAWTITDLEGRIVDQLPSQVGALMTPGTDGRRVAYLTRPCAMPLVEVYEIDRPPATKGLPPTPCAGARLKARPRVGASGLSIALRCQDDAAAGCVTEVAVLVRRRGRRTLRFDVPESTLLAGRERVLRVGRRRSLRGPLRVTVVLRARGNGVPVVRRFRIRG